jgi:hypothetical protein
VPGGDGFGDAGDTLLAIYAAFGRAGQLLLGVVRLLVARQRGNLPAVVEEARRLQTMAAFQAAERLARCLAEPSLIVMTNRSFLVQTLVRLGDDEQVDVPQWRLPNLSDGVSWLRQQAGQPASTSWRQKAPAPGPADGVRGNHHDHHHHHHNGLTGPS